jgi:hypothetical protein
VLGWAGVLLRNLELGKDATFRAFFDPSPSRAERDRDLERLKDAELLDPSSKWELARASYYLNSGDRRRAGTAAEALVRDEPRNLLAWTVLFQAATGHDQSRATRAATEIRRLNPLGSR